MHRRFGETSASLFSLMWRRHQALLKRRYVYTRFHGVTPQQRNPQQHSSSFGRAVGIFDRSVSLCLPASQDVLFVYTAPLCKLLLRSTSYTLDNKRGREGSDNKYGIKFNTVYRIPWTAWTCLAKYKVDRRHFAYSHVVLYRQYTKSCLTLSLKQPQRSMFFRFSQRCCGTFRSSGTWRCFRNVGNHSPNDNSGTPTTSTCFDHPHEGVKSIYSSFTTQGREMIILYVCMTTFKRFHKDTGASTQESTDGQLTHWRRRLRTESFETLVKILCEERQLV